MLFLRFPFFRLRSITRGSLGGVLRFLVQRGHVGIRKETCYYLISPPTPNTVATPSPKQGAPPAKSLMALTDRLMMPAKRKRPPVEVPFKNPTEASTPTKRQSSRSQEYSIPKKYLKGLSDEQKYVLELVNKGESVFFTGIYPSFKKIELKFQVIDA